MYTPKLLLANAGSNIANSHLFLPSSAPNHNCKQFSWHTKLQIYNYISLKLLVSHLKPHQSTHMRARVHTHTHTKRTETTVQWIPLPEFLERYTVGEALPADTKTLKNTVTPQLVKNEGCIDLAGTFFMVWYDTSYKIWFGVLKCHHKLGQLFLVQLWYCSKHALPSPSTKLGVCQSLLCHAHNLSCKHKAKRPCSISKYSYQACNGLAYMSHNMMTGESRTGEDVESSSHSLYWGTGSPQFNIALNDIVLLWHGQVSVTKTFRNIAQTHINAACAGNRDDLNSQTFGYFNSFVMGKKKCNRFDLLSYREIDVITSNACTVLPITHVQSKQQRSL